MGRGISTGRNRHQKTRLIGPLYFLACAKLRFNHFSLANASRRTLLALMLLTLSGCVQIAQTSEAAAPPAEQPAYAALAAKYFSSTMADRASFENFEISGLRWVHALKGWSWLACVHFVRSIQPEVARDISNGPRQQNTGQNRVTVCIDVDRNPPRAWYRNPAASPTIAVRPDERPSSAVVSINLMGSANWRRTWGDRAMLGRLPAAMMCLSLFLVTAAPLHALADDERPVPPLPIGPRQATAFDHARALSEMADTAARDGAKCQSSGAALGSQAYKECRALLEDKMSIENDVPPNRSDARSRGRN